MAFDLLSADDEPVYSLPLAERRERLEELLDPAVDGVRVSPAFEDGEALLAAARAQGLEGVVAKRAESPYREGRRTREWLKVKTAGRQEFAIAGYTRGEGRRARRYRKSWSSRRFAPRCRGRTRSPPASTRRRG